MILTKDDILRLLALNKTPPDMQISAVTEDSRRVTLGALFIAVKGEKSDGHSYIDAAVKAGAVAVLGDDITRMDDAAAVPYIYYDNPRQAAALLAHELAGNPTREMCVIGVTGTNGKTSTVFLTQHILKHAGRSCAKFGTLGYDLGDTLVEAPHTTPFGEDLAALFKQAKQAGIDHTVMEVSSHALAQERVAGIAFNVAAFTNLTRDHLDYHETMEAYLQAKLKLFERVREAHEQQESNWPCFTVVNFEDLNAIRFMEILPEKCYTFGEGGQICAESVRLRMDGANFHLATPWGSTNTAIKLVGRHNVLNALCAISVCGGLGVSLDTIVAGLESFVCVPGRFEPVSAGQDFQVVVDYAHTDDGLRNALRAARAVCAGRIICVFGCGGDRDKGKRPKMGAVAAELSDYVVLTSDNPRTEDPCRILLDVEVGLQRSGKRKHDDYVVIESRREAIYHAIFHARRGDMVLIAGKGHEDYQILGTERIHFDDREQALEALQERIA